MSYKVYTWRKPGETATDCGCQSLLQEEIDKAWSMLSLIGVGEHKGSAMTLTKEQLYAHNFDDERQLAVLLDRLFLRAHHRRLSAQVDAPKAAAK
jgi:hypothetical protein